MEMFICKQMFLIKYQLNRREVFKQLKHIKLFEIRKVVTLDGTGKKYLIVFNGSKWF